MGAFFNMGGYAAFVWPVYGLATIVIIGLIWSSLADYRAQQRLVSELEARAGGRARRAAKTHQQDQV